MSEQAAGCLAIVLCCGGSLHACLFAHAFATRLTPQSVVAAGILIALMFASFFGIGASAIVSHVGRRTDPEDRLRVVTAASAISVLVIGVAYLAYYRLVSWTCGRH